MNEESKSHGGRRSGAGRPTNDRNYMIGVRVSKEAYNKFQQIKNKSEFLDTLLKKEL